MPSNPAPMVQPWQDDVQTLWVDVTGPDVRAQTAATVELTLFRRRLALGAGRWRWCGVTRAAVRPAEPVTAPAGTRRSAPAQRPTIDAAVLGHVRGGRPVFTARGQGGLDSLDAALSGSARGDADLRRAWAAEGTTDASCRES